MRLTALLIVVSALFTLNIQNAIAGQDRKKDLPRLFTEPAQAFLLEEPTAALTIWREFQTSKPALVILSNNPFLQPIPASLKAEAKQLVHRGSATDIDKKAVYHSANPLLMPEMALSAALETDSFSKIIWVLPVPPTKKMVNPNSIRAQLLGKGDISEKEGSTIKPNGNQITAVFRNIPWTICRIDSLPDLNSPVVLHIDLSFFMAMYQNEIKTPLYSILASVGNEIKSKNLQLLAATISQSNLSRVISLRTRFFGKDIKRLIEEPAILTSSMPPLWQKRAQALYLDNLFQQERIQSTYLELDKTYPNDASIKYALYDITGQLKEGKRALAYLDEAVSLDRIYALEYINLAERAQNAGQNASAYAMLENASKAFPEDPFITLKKVGMHRDMGTMNHAGEMIKSLQKMTWSEIYDPEMQKFLKELYKEAEKPKGE